MSFTKGILIIVAVALLGLSQLAAEPGPAQARGALTSGVPVNIALRAGSLVDSVTVVVLQGWLNSDGFALDVTVTELTDAGDPVDHGNVVVNVSATTLLGETRGEAVVNVDWTPSSPSVLVGSSLRPCVQVLRHGQPFGGPQCSNFGPF